MRISRLVFLSWVWVAAGLAGALVAGERANAAELVPLGSEPAGTWGGIEYTRHVGRVPPCPCATRQTKNR